MDYLECPLCKKILVHFEGSSLEGKFYLPHAKCSCGFLYSPSPKITVPVGKSTYWAEDQAIKQVNEEILSKFKRKR